ncbi:hypothetical protein Lal_00040773, partial [Lupinus albus]
RTQLPGVLIRLNRNRRRLDGSALLQSRRYPYILLFFDDKREGNSDLSFDYWRRTLLILSIRAGNGRGYSHYALTRRAGNKDVMSVSALIRLQCIPIHSLCVGKAKPSALHCRGKGDTVPKGWLVLVTETDTDNWMLLHSGTERRVMGTTHHKKKAVMQIERARPSEIRSLRTFFLDMDQAPTSFLALARKRSRSPPTNKTCWGVHKKHLIH